MRVVAAVLLIALVGVGLLDLGSFLRAGKEGELVFSPESVDAGRVPLNQVIPARYEMRNVGDRPVQIVRSPRITAVEGC